MFQTPGAISVQSGNPLLMKAFAMVRFRFIILACLGLLFVTDYGAEPTPSLPKAIIDGTATGWHALGEKDFRQVNCKPETWSWTNGMIHCTGNPTGVMRTENVYTNFELVAQWRHLQSGGNSGIFVWATPE